MFIPPGTPLSGRHMDRVGNVVPGMHTNAFRPETTMEWRQDQIRHDPNKWSYVEPVRVEPVRTSYVEPVQPLNNGISGSGTKRCTSFEFDYIGSLCRNCGKSAFSHP